MPEVETATIRPAGLSSGLGRMLQAEGAGAFLEGWQGRRPKLAHGGRRKGKERSQETKRKNSKQKKTKTLPHITTNFHTPNARTPVPLARKNS